MSRARHIDAGPPFGNSYNVQVFVMFWRSKSQKSTIFMPFGALFVSVWWKWTSGRAIGSRGDGATGLGLDNFPATGFFFYNTLQMLLLCSHENQIVWQKKFIPAESRFFEVVFEGIAKETRPVSRLCKKIKKNCRNLTFSAEKNVPVQLSFNIISVNN